MVWRYISQLVSGMAYTKLHRSTEKGKRGRLCAVLLEQRHCRFRPQPKIPSSKAEMTGSLFPNPSNCWHKSMMTLEGGHRSQERDQDKTCITQPAPLLGLICLLTLPLCLLSSSNTPCPPFPQFHPLLCYTCFGRSSTIHQHTGSFSSLPAISPVMQIAEGCIAK